MELTDSLFADSDLPAASEPSEAQRVDFCAGLNDPQREAVQHREGPLLILAGPGSGKTRVIANRIAWLVSEARVHPSEILAITFTNKAAKEMRARVEEYLPTQGMWISTFHSMCARILRREIEVLPGFTRDFSIYDTSDKNQLIRQLLKRANIDRTQFKPAMLSGWISDWKNRKFAGEEPSGFEDGVESFQDEVLRRIRVSYEAAMSQNNALDFDDLLLKVVEIFEKNHGIRDAYASRFRYVMVDEYQDTNRVQYLLTRHLASAHGNLAVVGDPDQSIYAWRGADLNNILDFERDFGSPKVVKLEQNYRSTKNILKAAQHVISNNKARKEKDLWSDNDEGDLLVCIECGDEGDEAREIVSQIRSLQAQGTGYEEMAIFYRVNFMQRALEKALRLASVPYQIVAGVEFYTRREIRDLVGYLKLIANSADDVAFRRIVNVPARGIGEKSLANLDKWADDRRVSLVEACRSEEALLNVRGRAKKSLLEFGQLLEEFEPFAGGNASDALSALLQRLDYSSWLGQMEESPGNDREANVEEFLSYAEEFDRLHPDGGLRAFLEDISLVSEADDRDEEAKQVTLMTLHAAKGLEYPVVFIPGLEEELLPHIRALMSESGDGSEEDDSGIEEERRLFYVGMTRAEKRLIVTWAGRRNHFGQLSFRRPSRFLDEIPPELLEGHSSEEEEDDVLGEYETKSGDGLRIGETVLHDHFGRGTIERLQGTGVNARATVHFIQHGSKTLLLQYAKLTPVRHQ